MKSALKLRGDELLASLNAAINADLDPRVVEGVIAIAGRFTECLKPANLPEDYLCVYAALTCDGRAWKVVSVQGHPYIWIRPPLTPLTPSPVFEFDLRHMATLKASDFELLLSTERIPMTLLPEIRDASFAYQCDLNIGKIKGH